MEYMDAQMQSRYDAFDDAMREDKAELDRRARDLLAKIEAVLEEDRGGLPYSSKLTSLVDGVSTWTLRIDGDVLLFSGDDDDDDERPYAQCCAEVRRRNAAHRSGRLLALITEALETKSRQTSEET